MGQNTQNNNSQNVVWARIGSLERVWTVVYGHIHPWSLLWQTHTLFPLVLPSKLIWKFLHFQKHSFFLEIFLGFGIDVCHGWIWTHSTVTPLSNDPTLARTPLLSLLYCLCYAIQDSLAFIPHKSKEIRHKYTAILYKAPITHTMTYATKGEPTTMTTAANGAIDRCYAFVDTPTNSHMCLSLHFMLKNIIILCVIFVDFLMIFCYFLLFFLKKLRLQ